MNRQMSEWGNNESMVYEFINKKIIDREMNG